MIGYISKFELRKRTARLLFYVVVYGKKRLILLEVNSDVIFVLNYIVLF